MRPLFRLPLPHGLCIGVARPEPQAAADAYETALHPEELRHAATLPPHRRTAFLAGRLALRSALDELGIPAGALLSDDRGAPTLPPGARGSVSHKKSLAVALVTVVDEDAPGAAGVRIGVDLEEERAPKFDLAVRLLTPTERQRLPASPEARWRSVLLHFSLKEAVYKALDPHLRRHVAFHEVELEVAHMSNSDYGGARVALVGLRSGEGPFFVQAGWYRVQDHILATAQLQTHPD